MMNASEFNRRVDDVLLRIEAAVEESGADIGYENLAAILTLFFEDGSPIIIDRRTPAGQLRVAARDGGWHFDFDSQQALRVHDTDGRRLFHVLGRICSSRAGGQPGFRR